MAEKETRREKALRTRRRMLAAAYREFSSKGYAAATMDGIAGEAKVAVQTLFFTFGTKAKLIEEALGAAIVGFERWSPLEEPFTAAAATSKLPFWPAFAAEPAGPIALEILVEGAAAILRLGAPLLVVMAQAHDEDVRAAWARAESRRVAGFGELARTMARKGPGFTKGVGEARVRDLFVALLSPALYQDLVHARGWSPSAWKTMILELLFTQLYLACPRRSPRRLRSRP